MNNSIRYQVNRQFFKLVGAVVRTYDANNQLVCKAKQKAFKLREQVNFFADEEQQRPLFAINARNIIDIGATYDITDAQGQLVGSLQRKGLGSVFVRDEWAVLDRAGRPIAKVLEDSAALGALRRYIDLVSLFVPQTFHVFHNDATIGSLKQNRNPFIVKLSCEYTLEAKELLGETMLLAIPNLLSVIEARQN